MKNKAYYLDLEYEIIVRKLSEEDGGGFFTYYKDFKGVMGDGKSIEEAMTDVKSACSIYF